MKNLAKHVILQQRMTETKEGKAVEWFPSCGSSLRHHWRLRILAVLLVCVHHGRLVAHLAVLGLGHGGHVGLRGSKGQRTPHRLVPKPKEPFVSGKHTTLKSFRKGQ